jgi:hypothetical protein
VTSALTQNAGSSTIREVITGLIHRLCDEIDKKELQLIYTCLFEEINICIKDGYLDHLKCLIDFLTFALQNSKQSDVAGMSFHLMAHMLWLLEFYCFFNKND